jgi:GNAT superfamily N-acetyltransferase
LESVRVAGPADAAAVADLLRSAREQLGGQRGGEALAGQIRSFCLPGPGENLSSWLPGPGESPSSQIPTVWLGLLDEVPVGVAAAFLDDQEGSQRVGRIDALWVEPEAREVGVGAALLQEATAWLWQSGATAIDASALPGDRATKRMLESAGFAARLVVMRRSGSGSGARSGDPS